MLRDEDAFFITCACAEDTTENANRQSKSFFMGTSFLGLL